VKHEPDIQRHTSHATGQVKKEMLDQSRGRGSIAIESREGITPGRSHSAIATAKNVRGGRVGHLAVTNRTQGEIEATICEGMGKFEQEYMGRGPKNIHCHLIGDLVIVRLQGVLTAAEQHLVRKAPSEKGRDLLKQVRTQLLETARPFIEAMIESVTGSKVVSLHHDISTVTGEEIVLFTLAESVLFRESKRSSRG